MAEQHFHHSAEVTNIYASEKIKTVHKTHAKINSAIEFLDEKLDKKLELHEKEFLMAYRRKMLEVQTELLVLKKMSNEEDFYNQQEELKRRQDLEVMQLKNDTNVL